MADEIEPTAAPALPTEVFLSIGGPSQTEGLGGPGGDAASSASPATAPLASGTPGQPLAAQPPFTLEDLATAPPDYWDDLDAGYEAGEITTDDYYSTHRQRVHDDENPMLKAIRGEATAATPAAAAGGAPPPATAPAPTAAAPAAPPPPSTAEQVSTLLATIGLRGIVPVQPASSLVEALYATTPNKEANPVYRTLARLAGPLDVALTALNVPITGIGDLANVILAPLTLGLQAAGVDKDTIQGFVKNTELLPEMAAALALPGAGVLGTMGKVGNLAEVAAGLAPMMARAGRVVKLEESFTATMRDLWKTDRGEILLPGPDDLRTLAAKYEAAVIEARRGGPRPHAQVQAEAQDLIDRGLVSWDWVQQVKPGTTLNDAKTVAVVKVLADSGMRLETLAAKALETQAPADIQAVLQQLYLHGQVDPKRIGVVTENARSTSAMNDPTSGLTRYLVQFEELLRNQTAGVDGLTVARAIASFQSPGQLAVFARQAAKPGFWEMFHEYYVNGLLWGPKTWMANFLGNTVTTLWSVPERATAAALGGGKGVQMGEAWELIHGVLGSQLDALRLAAKGFAAGESQFARGVSATDKIELPRKAISSEALELTGFPGAAVDLVGTVVRVPGRVLSGTDDYFKVINWRAEQRALALREARQEALAEGLTGRAFADFVDRRIAHKMADPPLSIQRGAAEHALYQTFTKELGETGQMIQGLANVPAGRLILPFVRTPINMAKWVGERTPLMLLNFRFWREINGKDRAVADLAKAKVALGSAALAMGALWAYHGQITGAGPADKKIRQDMIENRGWRPYSVRIGNTYIGINRLEPPGMLLTLAADFTEAMLNSDPDTVADWEEAANAAVVAVAKGFASRTMVKGVAQTMAVLSDPDRMGESFGANLLTSFLPLSGLVRQTEQVLDPEMREADGVMQRMRAQIPGLSDLLPPRRNLDGDPIYLTGVWGPIAVSEGTDDKVAKERITVGAHIPEIPKTHMGVALTPKERDYWAFQRGKMKVGGMTVRERQAETIASDFYKGSSQEVKAFLLERDITLHQNQAWLKTLEKYPNLQTSVDKARDAKIQKRFSPAPAETPLTPLLRSLGR